MAFGRIRPHVAARNGPPTAHSEGAATAQCAAGRCRSLARGLLAHHLRHVGHEVWEANNAASAFELFECHHPPLLLVDQNLPAKGPSSLLHIQESWDKEPRQSSCGRCWCKTNKRDLTQCPCAIKSCSPRPTMMMCIGPWLRASACWGFLNPLSQNATPPESP